MLRLLLGATLTLGLAAAPTSVTSGQAAPAFEVASLKERDPHTPLGLVGLQRSPGRLVGRCVTLKALLFFAYNLTLASPIDGLPDWASTPCADGFSANTYEFQATMPTETTVAQAQAMMQTFLAERFKLAVHWETRTLPFYGLTLAPGGFNGTPTDTKVAKRPQRCPPDDPACRQLHGPLSLAQLGQLASTVVERPVMDQTGVEGTYDIDLQWAGDNALNSSLPSFPTALRETLGLVLKAQTGPVKVLVIDHAQKPTPN